MALFRVFLLLGVSLGVGANLLQSHEAITTDSESRGDTRNASPGSKSYDYVLFATNKTSTMQKEMAQAGDGGYRFKGVMGGETSFGGSEVVVVMSREAEDLDVGHYEYKLLATSKSSTMQKELQEAGDKGFEYVGQTVFHSTFGGQEVVIILERDRDQKAARYQYKLLATKKTSTMQKELRVAGEEGFEFVGLTVSETQFGGTELVSILRIKME